MGKFNWETLDRVLKTYTFCASAVQRLPKTADDLTKAKLAFAEYQRVTEESLRLEEKLLTEGLELNDRLLQANVLSKALDQDVTDFLAKVRAAFPQSTQQLDQVCQNIIQGANQ